MILELQIFGYMTAGSPFINTFHLCTRYSGFGGRSDLVGKEVGFTGDSDQYGGVPVMQFLTKEMP